MTSCWIYRVWEAIHPDRRRTLPYFLQRHLAECRACRSQEASQEQMRNVLSAAARAARVSAPPFLTRRILFALDRDGSAVPASRFGQARYAVMAISACLMFVVWFWASREGQRSSAEVRVPQISAASAEAHAEGAIDSAVAVLLTDADRWLGITQAMDQSLQTEFEAVVQDARAAVRFVAGSFMLEL